MWISLSGTAGYVPMKNWQGLSKTLENNRPREAVLQIYDLMNKLKEIYWIPNPAKHWKTSIITPHCGGHSFHVRPIYRAQIRVVGHDVPS